MMARIFKACTLALVLGLLVGVCLLLNNVGYWLMMVVAELAFASIYVAVLVRGGKIDLPLAGGATLQTMIDDLKPQEAQYDDEMMLTGYEAEVRAREAIPSDEIIGPSDWGHWVS